MLVCACAYVQGVHDVCTRRRCDRPAWDRINVATHTADRFGQTFRGNIRQYGAYMRANVCLQSEACSIGSPIGDDSRWPTMSWQ